ncbi:MAG: S9 family peptidase [Acidobacteria bacterium]|nr:MAG: S9 family peptidase [Acidobacteriota bacterium]PYS81626.1 MAG: S9 family peptidase [Acidobacteriota bacterium]
MPTVSRRREIMKRLVARLCVFALALCAAALAQAQAPRARFTVQDLLKIRRVADPQLSPDGHWVAYQITLPDVAANRSVTQIYLIATGGGEPKQLTDGAASASEPRWSPDGKALAFVSGDQLWTMDASGGGRKQITSVSTGADGPLWSPDGKWIAFATDVYPDCADDACNRARDEQAAASKAKAHVATRLLYRHWTEWKGDKRTHVFVVPSAGGAARDLTPGDFDAPPFSLGDPVDYAFSPDSKELAFARNTDTIEAASTNADIFLVPVAGGEPVRLTGGNRGADKTPRYSPDGRYLAYRSQATAGFESDRWRLMLYDRQTKQTRELLPKLDAYVDDFTFAPDGGSIYFVSGERGVEPIFNVSLADGSTRKLIGGFDGDLQISRDSRLLVFTRSTAASPSEIYTARLDGIVAAGGAGNQAVQLTHTNDALMQQFGLRPAEETTWAGASGTKIAGWIVKPPDFDSSKKYPLVVLIHGGPQGAWDDNWGYRWNPQIYAADGYVVLMPNPRGSTGYGQQLTNEISGDWGGKAYTDIMNGVAEVASLPYVDKNNIGAAGASYGGYMVDWILGHNDDPRFHFKTLVSHAGVFNLTSMYGATEELWFAEWEFKGVPWEHPELYEKWSPHLFAKNFHTPTLVTGGELDFRVPVDQDLQLFTYLQRQGVESKLVVFPDEGHWILKPADSQLWYTTVLDWLDSHLKSKT